MANKPRRHYKQEYLDTLIELTKYKIKYEDCKKYIREARKIIISHNLQEELNYILSLKYGFILSSTIMPMNKEFENETGD